MVQPSLGVSFFVALFWMCVYVWCDAFVCWIWPFYVGYGGGVALSRRVVSWCDAFLCWIWSPVAWCGRNVALSRRVVSCNGVRKGKKC